MGSRQVGRTRRRARGAVATEYAVTLALVTVVAAVATTPLGAMLVAYFRTLAWIIDLPIP